MKITPKINFLNSLIVIVLTLGSVVSAQNVSNNSYVKNELLVKYTDGTASGFARDINARTGAVVKQDFPDIGWQLIKLPSGVSVETGLAQYAGFAGVETAQPNYYYKLTATPNDTSYGSLYGMTKINAPTAWNTTTGSSEIVVADIDTGIKYTHEDLAANMWRNAGETPGNNVDDDGNGFIDDYYGYDFFDNDGDPMDLNGHGTHTAGTIGAVGNNAKGVAGVNWNVRLMAIKIYDAGGNSTSSILINAYNYVRLMRTRGVNIRATNNSYGDCNEACGYDQATKDAIDALGNADVLQVFAAGNNGRNIDSTPFYPASYTTPSILVVAASDSNDNRAGFSNYGAVTADLAAPGVSILSTVIGTANYGNLSGTSMATPHTTGAAALLAAAYPNLSAASLKASLMNTVTPLAQWNGLVKTGGRLNIGNAVQTPTVCSFALSANTATATAAGGSQSVNVTAPLNCDFSVLNSNSWITVANGNPGSGSTAVNLTIAPNSGNQSRSGIVVIAGQNFVITQNGQAQTPLRNVVLDFDGDGKTDYSVIQNVNGQMIWQNFRSANGANAVSFGLFAEDKAVPADYDGDGKTDFAVWRGGSANGLAYFYVLNSADNVMRAVQWGTAGDVPQTAADFDGDRRADFVVTRQTGNLLYWYIIKSSDNGIVAQQFGLGGDKAVRGDYDGDGKTDLAVYRPANLSPANTFFVQKSSDGALQSMQFGVSTTDRIVPGDYDGDGKTDFGVWRAATGVWYWQQSSNNSQQSRQFGQDSDVLTPGDYDGDGKIDFAVWRPNAAANQSAVFYVNNSSTGFASFAWGQNGMIPTAANFQIQF